MEDLLTVRKSLDEVFEFSGEMNVLNSRGEEPERTRINEVKRHCKNLKDRGIYNFNVDCDDMSLCKQIKKFAFRVD